MLVIFGLFKSYKSTRYSWKSSRENPTT